MTQQSPIRFPTPPSFLLGDSPPPVLAGTRLCLELLLEQPAVDLQSMTELLRGDPGAVLRLYALLAEEFPSPEDEDRPSRFGDCIASLNADRILGAMTSGSARGEEQQRLVPHAHHAATIAWYARLVAESLGLCAEQAWFVGLFHDLGSMSSTSVLHPVPLDPTAAALELARAHHLPGELVLAIAAVHRKDPADLWTAVIDAAHDLAGSSVDKAGDSHRAK